MSFLEPRLAHWRPQWWQIQRDVVKVWSSGADSPRIAAPSQAARVSDILRDGARDPRAIRATAALGDRGLGPVSWVDQTGSTNADLLAAADAGAPHGTVLVAEYQTAGRGRRDRRWESAPGDALMMSVLLISSGGPETLPSLATAVGVAAAETCIAWGADGVRLKWPNDLVVGPPGDRRKLAGILAQSIVGPDRAAVVVGLGLNVRGERLHTIAPAAVALDELVAAPDREELLVEILVRLDELLAMSPTDLRERYLAWSATVGTTVEVTMDETVLTGPAVDVTLGGSLVVDAADGRREIVVGDVISVRPDASG